MEILLSIFPALLIHLPVILVWLAGMILAIIYWKRHPWVSLLTFIAVTGILITSLVDTYLGMWLPILLQQQGFSINQVGIVMGIRGLISSLMTAGFWILLLAAIFGWRNKPEKTF